MTLNIEDEVNNSELDMSFETPAFWSSGGDSGPDIKGGNSSRVWVDGFELAELTLDDVLDKLDDDRFTETINDEEDLGGIVNFLELKHDDFIDINDEAYKERMCKLLGMAYKKPSLILIEKVEVTRGFAESKICDKIKEPLSPRLNEDEYSICCENTTHMMKALKEARMESREMLLSIQHSLKMLLDIISKMNKKLEDEKIKRNDKGKEKLNNF
uniref:Uncharacterized protein n=1 Tax=Tanacetum cinerariifolium TaxID=118510 RepID=A0A6L2MRG4_TANCI|nr:hypothetical protein [Tanacetum cinerariifolium]